MMSLRQCGNVPCVSPKEYCDTVIQACLSCWDLCRRISRFPPGNQENIRNSCKHNCPAYYEQQIETTTVISYQNSTFYNTTIEKSKYTSTAELDWYQLTISAGIAGIIVLLLLTLLCLAFLNFREINFKMFHGNPVTVECQMESEASRLNDSLEEEMNTGNDERTELWISNRQVNLHISKIGVEASKNGRDVSMESVPDRQRQSFASNLSRRLHDSTTELKQCVSDSSELVQHVTPQAHYFVKHQSDENVNSISGFLGHNSTFQKKAIHDYHEDFKRKIEINRPPYLLSDEVVDNKIQIEVDPGMKTRCENYLQNSFPDLWQNGLFYVNEDTWQWAGKDTKFDNTLLAVLTDMTTYFHSKLLEHICPGSLICEIKSIERYSVTRNPHIKDISHIPQNFIPNGLGTIGMFFIDSDNRIYAMTCQHVFTKASGFLYSSGEAETPSEGAAASIDFTDDPLTAITQRYKPDPDVGTTNIVIIGSKKWGILDLEGPYYDSIPQEEKDAVKQHSGCTNITTVVYDIALVELDKKENLKLQPYFDPDSWENGKKIALAIPATNKIEKALEVTKLGAKTGLTTGKIIYAYEENITGTFVVESSDRSKPFAQKGDSGSLVFFDENGVRVVVGIVRGVDKHLTKTYCCNFKYNFDEIARQLAAKGRRGLQFLTAEQVDKINTEITLTEGSSIDPVEESGYFSTNT